MINTMAISMKTTDDIEAKIDNLFSAMKSDDHKAFAQTVKSVPAWNIFSDAERIADGDVISFFINDSKFTTVQKKSLLKLMVGQGMDISSNFYFIAENYALLKFVLSEFAFPNEVIEEAILNHEKTIFDRLPLRNLKICFEYGYKPSNNAVISLLADAAAYYDTDKMLFYLNKFHPDINLSLEREPSVFNRECVFEKQELSLLAYASDWNVIGSSFEKYSKLAKNLLDLGADVNFVPPGSETTALMCAANINIFNFLLKYGADLYAVTPTLKTNMLQRQAENYRSGLPIVKKLVEKYHFDIHYRDASGKTALNYAIGAKNYDVIHYLCKHGALEDVEDIEKFVKNTVTWLYSEREKLFVTHLMKYGFDKDNSGRYLLDYCDKAEIDPEWLNICIEEESGLDDGFLLTEFSESQISEIEKIIARKVKK